MSRLLGIAVLLFASLCLASVGQSGGEKAKDKKPTVFRGKEVVWRELSLPVLTRQMADGEGFALLVLRKLPK